MPEDVIKPATETQLRAEILINELLNDVTIGSTIREKAKAKYPDLRFPEDTMAPVITELKTKIGTLEEQNKIALDKLAAREKADEEAKTFSDLDSKVTAAAREYGLTDEGRVKMLERMKEQSNFDAEAAAAWVASKAPPKPVDGPSYVDKRINLFGSNKPDESLKLLHTNTEAYVDGQIEEMLANPEKYVAETFGGQG